MSYHYDYYCTNDNVRQGEITNNQLAIIKDCMLNLLLRKIIEHNMYVI